MITQFVAGGVKGNYAPRASFTVSLFTSFVSKYTEMASLGAVLEKAMPFITQGFTALIPNPFGLRLPALFSQPNDQEQSEQQDNNQNPNAPRLINPTLRLR